MDIPEPLVKIRNPHGHGEWMGRYSDVDTARMTSKLKASLEYTAADDGTFFLALCDFLAVFSRVDLCVAFSTSCEDDSWYQHQCQGEIRRDMCGTAKEAWYHNPRYQLR